MIRRIRAAFDGVSRAGGVSWSEAGVIDNYGSMDERLAARASDTDEDWSQLVDDPDGDPAAGWGGFSFLDAIGFRYFLPAAMVRCVREGLGDILCLHLTVPPPGHELREHQLSRLSALDRRQRLCVAAFLRFMGDWSGANGDRPGRQHWKEALESHWSQFR